MTQATPSPFAVATGVRDPQAGFYTRSSGSRLETASGCTPDIDIPTSFPRIGCGLAHGLQVRVAALLQQSAHGAMEILHTKAQKLGNERVGAAAPGDAPGLGDRLNAALTGNATSLAPATTASIGGLPISRWR